MLPTKGLSSSSLSSQNDADYLAAQSTYYFSHFALDKNLETLIN